MESLKRALEQNEGDFEKDIAAHKLPAVSWLVDQDLADEHPGYSGVCDGENWTVSRLTRQAYCQSHGLEAYRFNQWVARLRRRSAPRA